MKYEQPRGATHTRQVKNTIIAGLASLVGGAIAWTAHRAGYTLSTRRAATGYVVGVLAGSIWLPFPLLLLALLLAAAGAWTIEVRQPLWWRRELERMDRRHVALHWNRAKTGVSIAAGVTTDLADDSRCSYATGSLRYGLAVWARRVVVWRVIARHVQVWWGPAVKAGPGRSRSGSAWSGSRGLGGCGPARLGLAR